MDHERLHQLNDFENGQWNEQTHNDQSLPRADGGKDAWLFLASCFVLEALIWGFPYSFGIFQAYYTSHAPFSERAGDVASIGTTATGLMFFGLPFAAIFAQRFPRIRRPAMAVGVLTMVVSLFAASFCKTVPGLIATEGVLYAIGGLLTYFPLLQLVDEWFVARKGMAYGIMWAGTGFSGVVVPFVLQWLLDDYGFKTALRAWAIIVVSARSSIAVLQDDADRFHQAMLSLPSLFFVKNRLPLPASSAFRPSDYSYLRGTPFLIFLASITFQGLGAFLPSLWLPSFARTMDLPSFAGPLSLALYNLAGCLGAVAHGMLADRLHVSNAMLVSCIGQTIAIFAFWGCATNEAMLYIFAVIFGIFGGGYSGTWSGCVPLIRPVDGSNRNFDTGTAIALLAMGRGVGAVVSGPISTRLLELGIQWHAKLAYGTSYGIVIVFTGVSVFCGSAAWFAKAVRLV